MPHITYEYTVPRVSSTPASSTQEQPPLASLVANASYAQLPISGNEVEARGENWEKEKNQSTPLGHKGSMEAHGGVQWEHQAPCNLSEKPEVLHLRASEGVPHKELGKQDGLGECRISTCFFCSLVVIIIIIMTGHDYKKINQQQDDYQIVMHFIPFRLQI